MDKHQWAENLLKDEFFKETIEELRGVFINKFILSEFSDKEVREECYLNLRALEFFESHLESLSAEKLINKSKVKIL